MLMWLQRLFGGRKGDVGPQSGALLSEGQSGFRRDLSPMPGTDRTWRPDLWEQACAIPEGDIETATVLCDGVTLFHDADHAALALRQISPGPVAPFALQLERAAFDGSFQSLVFDLPESLHDGLRLSHLIRLDLALGASALRGTQRPLFVRLNIKHGPNVEVIALALGGGQSALEGPIVTEFDLAYCRFSEKRIEKLWLDLIIEGSGPAGLQIDDVIISRRPRAPL